MKYTKKIMSGVKGALSGGLAIVTRKDTTEQALRDISQAKIAFKEYINAREDALTEQAETLKSVIAAHELVINKQKTLIAELEMTITTTNEVFIKTVKELED